MRPDAPDNLSEGSEEYPSSVSSDEGISDRLSDLNFAEVGKPKIFNDIVHPHLVLPGLCCKIINTPQFQRLRNLKQLGLCYHVYPSACHNRFEHCIGTSYLSGKYAKILQKNQPELGISEIDILCLYVAGLCHDLGHGPFSHTWEVFVREYDPDFCHEDMSIQMLDYLIQDNNLWELFQANGLDKIDLVFIKELIRGHPIDPQSGQKVDVFQGRKPNKYFFYQIVSNSDTKIDVDKFDYIMRDCKQLNVTTSLDFERIFKNSRVFGVTKEKGPLQVVGEINENTKTTIVYRKKILGCLEDLFRGRFSLHQKAYQHRVTKVVEEMVLDGLHAAEPHFKVSGRNGTFSLSNAHKDISAFMKLTDSVFEQVVNWDNGGPQAKKIFKDIETRNLYECIGQISTTSKFDDSLLKELGNIHKSIKLIPTKINYGCGSKNPLSKALFYEKNQPGEILTLKLPNAQEEAKCFIVIRPSYTEIQADGDNVISMEMNKVEFNLPQVKEQVNQILQKYNFRLETE